MFPKIRYIIHEDKQPIRFEIDLESEGLDPVVVEYEKMKFEQGESIHSIWVARIRGLEMIINPASYEMEESNPTIKRIASRGLQILYGNVANLRQILADVDVQFTEVLTEGEPKPKERELFSDKLRNIFP